MTKARLLAVAKRTLLGVAMLALWLGPVLPVVATESVDLDSEPARSVARMARIGSSTSPSFSPDGQTLAFVSDLSGRPQVWTVPVTGGWPRQVTALEDTVGSVAWSPDGDWLAVSAAPGGGMNQQVWLVSPDGVELRRLTAGGRETNWLGPWSDDGRWLAFATNRRDPAAMDARRFAVPGGDEETIVENPGLGTVVDWSPDGRFVLLDRVAGRGSNDLFLRELESGEERLLTPHEGPGSFEGRFSSDGGTVFVASNADRDRIAFGRIDVSAPESPGPIELLVERDDAELELLAVSPRGDEVALVWNVAGRSELELYELEGGRRRPVSLGVDLISQLEYSRDGRRLALVGRGATRPADVFVLDLRTGTGRQVTFSPHPGVDLDTLVAPELVRFPAHDGLELSAWLYRPPGATEPAPWVLSFHGGPEGQERPRLSASYQALLRQGIGVMAPNIRGSSGFGKRFVNLDNRELRFDANRDIATSAEWLVEQGIADPERLGVTGGSYGGYAVMVAVTEYPDLFAAGVNLFGMVNFETFFDNTEPWMAAISGTEYGDPETQRELLRRLSPIHRLDRVKTPLLVQHGANDTNVPVVEAEQVVENLERRGVPVEYLLFPDEGHGFRKEPNRVASTVATVEWFVRHLKDEASADR